MSDPVIVIHGGAWGVPDVWVSDTISGVKEAARIGYEILLDGGSAVDAVEAAVRYLEDDEFFNAGRGSSLNLAGKVAMDCSLQRGCDLEAGCVALLGDVAHPVSLARAVMETSPHAFLAGEGARAFAVERGLKLLPPESFVTEAARRELQDFLKDRDDTHTRKDTVGAVALDRAGHVASATSSGGTAGKAVGRIGDVPLIGCGTYADDAVGAVSCTGHGESILKYCVAHTIITLMAAGLSSEEATKKAVESMTRRLSNTGGGICVSKNGDVGFHFTTTRMSWCYMKIDEIHFGIEPGQHVIEKYSK